MSRLKYIALSIVLLLASCAPEPKREKGLVPVNVLGNSITLELLRRGVPVTVNRAYGASSYVPVSREWIAKTVYPEYASQLADAGLWKDGRPRWTSTSQCNYFADKVVTVAQERLFNDRFHSFDSTESPAIGIIWYLKGAIPGHGHAINVALMEDNSLTFFEPQGATYQEVSLTINEIKSIWFVKF